VVYRQHGSAHGSYSWAIDNAALERISRLIHLTLFAFKAWFFMVFLGMDPKQGKLVRQDQP
jgi:hypothetical protein